LLKDIRLEGRYRDALDESMSWDRFFQQRHAGCRPAVANPRERLTPPIPFEMAMLEPAWALKLNFGRRVLTRQPNKACRLD
jgi:hypothetical protein